MLTDVLVGTVIGILAEECETFTLTCAGEFPIWRVSMKGIIHNPARKDRVEEMSFTGGTMEEAATKAADFFGIVY